MIEIQKVSAGYEGKTVLQQISTSFEKGKITVLVGPNGCGKSTLLKTIVRIVPHSQGEIRVNECLLKQLSTKELAKKVAYLPQNKKAPDISVMKMVLHGRFPYLNYPRKYRAQDLEIAKRALKWAGLEELAEERVSKLSGGMQQKVFIAMALAQDADTILLDEPTTYLDIVHQMRLMEMARQLAKEGKAVVMVLHDLTQALSIADQVVVLKNGTLIDQGSAEEVYANASLEKAFGVRVEKVITNKGEEIWHYSHFS